MTGSQHIALRIALALGALVSGAPLASAGDPVDPSGVSKSGTDGVGGIEKTPGPTPTQTTGTTAPNSPTGYDMGPWKDLGQAKAGAQGEPSLTGMGTGLPGSVIALVLANGRPLALGTLVVGLSAAPVPFKGGTLVPTPQFLLFGLPVSAQGTLILPAKLPAALPSGLNICAQIWLPDPSASYGLSATNGLALQVP
jgi:hypothetical protein